MRDDQEQRKLGYGADEVLEKAESSFVSPVNIFDDDDCARRSDQERQRLDIRVELLTPIHHYRRGVGGGKLGEERREDSLYGKRIAQRVRLGSRKRAQHVDKRRERTARVLEALAGRD